MSKMSPESQKRRAGKGKTMQYVPPDVALAAFTCPHCGVYAQQNDDMSIALQKLFMEEGRRRGTTDKRKIKDTLSTDLVVKRCHSCGENTMWYRTIRIYPNRGNAPQPNPDMPDSAKTDYEEAASISDISPRAAAALLRLAIQKLCIDLGGKGKNLNDDIGELVKNGLPVTVQQALDTVRVIGNNAVHPAEINADDAETVTALFGLLNLIVEYMITNPKKIEELYGKLPEGTREAVAKRDEPKP